ncbi:MAG: RES domain-containing protein, partial [Actinomycetota bacterium]
MCSLEDAYAFRYSNYDTPFWARENTNEGRWHKAGDGPTQYLTLHPEGAWAELAREEMLHTDAEMALVRTTLWVARVTQGGIVDYSSEEKAAKGGFPFDALTNDDQDLCRHHGSSLRERGFTGVLAPSAALPGATNLTLFGPRLLSGWGEEPKLAACLPACVVAVGAP